MTHQPAGIPASPPKRPSILLVSNEKGGVGKTTVSTNLAASMAADYGLNVLYLDMDPQCNATRVMLRLAQRPEEQPGHRTIRDLLLAGASYAEVIRPTQHHPQLYLLPGDRNLEYTTASLVQRLAEQQPGAPAAQLTALLLRWARQHLRASLPEGFDVVIIDSPPSRGTLPLQLSLALADRVLMVAKPDADSKDGMVAISTLAKQMTQLLGVSIPVCGVVMNMLMSGRPRETRVIQSYRTLWQNYVLEQTVPNHDAVVAHSDRGELVALAAHRTPAGVALRRLAAQVLVRMQVMPRTLPGDIIGSLPDEFPVHMEEAS